MISNANLTSELVGRLDPDQTPVRGQPFHSIERWRTSCGARRFRTMFAIVLSGPAVRRIMPTGRPSMKETEMLRYAVVLLIIALVAGLLGFTGIAASAVQIAKVLFFVFLLLFLASLIVGLMRRK